MIFTPLKPKYSMGDPRETREMYWRPHDTVATRTITVVVTGRAGDQIDRTIFELCKCATISFN